MRIWVVRASEPMPFQPGVRLWRCGELSQRLADAGHDVTWWQSTFDHVNKVHLFDGPKTIKVQPGYTIRLLHGPAYKRNVSISRLINYGVLGRRFAEAIETMEPPEVILASMPTMEMALVAVRYGKKHGIPVVVDIRDLWPDIFINPLPGVVRPFARLPLMAYYKMAKDIMKDATAITGVSQEYVDWGLLYAGRKAGPLDRPVYLGYRRRHLKPDALAAEQQTFLDMGVDPSKTICCFFGMFGFSYDLAVVVRAARILQQQGDDRYQFVLCGDGDRAAEWKDGTEDLRNIIWPGWVSVDAVTALMEMSSIGLTTYRKVAKQSLPNKPFEYFSKNLPLLSCLEGELRQIIEEEKVGAHYIAEDEQSFLEALQTIPTGGSELEAMRRHIEELFETRYSADAVYTEFIAYLDTLAKGIVPQADTGAEI